MHCYGQGRGVPSSCDEDEGIGDFGLTAGIGAGLAALGGEIQKAVTGYYPGEGVNVLNVGVALANQGAAKAEQINASQKPPVTPAQAVNTRGMKMVSKAFLGGATQLPAEPATRGTFTNDAGGMSTPVKVGIAAAVLGAGYLAFKASKKRR